MKTIRTLCLFLLFVVHAAEADHVLSTTNTDLPESTDQSGSPTFTVETHLTNTYHQNPGPHINGTGGDCLIDTEMGLIAIGSAGGLILCLLVTTFVLACQICVLQRRGYIPRTRHSNTDIISATHYWRTDQTEIEGLVGPCDTNVMLEEVKTDKTHVEKQEAKREAGAGLSEGNPAPTNPEDKGLQIKSSSSKDSCLEIPKDLENMPLVV